MRCLNAFEQYLSRLATFFVAGTLLSSCSVNETLQGQYFSSNSLSISGRVNLPSALLDLSSLSTFQVAQTRTKNFFKSLLSPYAGPLACTPSVHLYPSTWNGLSIEEPAATGTLFTNGRYEFTNLTSAGVTSTSLKNYVVVVDTCQNIFSRALTSSASQNVSLTSDLLHNAQMIATYKNIVSIDTTLVSELETSLYSVNDGDLGDVYTRLAADTALAQKFQTAFGYPISEFATGFPKVTLLNSPPARLDEETVVDGEVLIEHWNPSYSSLIEWRLDNQLVSQTSTLAHSLSANTQGDRVLTLTIGRNAGGNAFDNTQPKIAKIFNFTVANSVLPTSPSLVMVTPATTLVDTRTLTLGIQTGAGLANCETFSKLAVTEETSAAPTNLNDFNITCSTDGIQNQVFTLASANDGSKTLRLWALDASNTVSTEASELVVELDTTIPTLTLDSHNSGAYFGGNAEVIAWTTSDINLANQPIALSYSLDSGVTWIAIATGLTNGANSGCTIPGSSTGCYSWSVATVNSTTVRIRVESLDNAGNLATAASSSDLAVSSAAPTPPDITLVSDALTKNVGVSIANADCTAPAQFIFFSESATPPAPGDPNWLACAVQNYSFNVSAGDGEKTIYAWMKDGSTHISSPSSVTVTLDQTLPALTWVTAPSAVSSCASCGGTTSTSLAWKVSEANISSAQNFTIEYSLDNGVNWSAVTSVPANNGPLSNQTYTTTWNVPNAVSSTQALLRVSVTDLALNTHTINSATFSVDDARPAVTAMGINGGTSTTNESSIPFSFQAADTTSKISKLCLKTTTAAPSSDADPCWFSLTGYGVTPALSVNISNLYYNIGNTPGTLTYYVWAMDAGGNISVNSDTLNVDKGSVTYVSQPPPQVEDLVVTSTDTPNQPPTLAQMTVTAPNMIYVKWKVSSDSGFGASPINLFYGTDDATYTTNIAPNLVNGANGSCTVDAAYSGCAVFAAPTSSYFRVRLQVEDSNNLKAALVSNPMNAGALNLLAGNTDVSTNVSAKAAVLKPNSSYWSTLAVLNDGRIFVADERGLGWLNPATKNYEILIPDTNASTGDGGSVASATLTQASRVYADYSDNLLLVDSMRVRKINTQVSPMTISTFIGGGTDDTSATLVSATDYKFSFTPILFLLPNGNIWWQTGTSSKLRIYNGSTDQSITTLTMSGTGNTFSATQNNATCTSDVFFLGFNQDSEVDVLAWRVKATSSSGACYYGGQGYSEARAYATLDPETGTALLSPMVPTIRTVYGSREYHYYSTSKLGDIYAHRVLANDGSYGSPQIYKLNKTTMTWSVHAGKASNGTCADGTDKDACTINAQSITFNGQGQMFYIDGVAKTVRTIDNNGKVQTIMGDALGSADDTKPLLSRFAAISDFGMWSKTISGVRTDYFTIFDLSDVRFREFTPGTELKTVAGVQYSGAPNVTNLAVEQPINTSADAAPSKFLVDTNGDIYYPTSPKNVTKVARATGRWTNQLVPSMPSYTYYGPVPHFATANYILFGSWQHSGTAINGSFSIFSRATNTYVPIVHGTPQYSTVGSGFCPVGTAANACTDMATPTPSFDVEFDIATSRWLFVRSGTLVSSVAETGGGTVTSFATLPRAANKIALNRSADLSTNFIYYCASSNSKLYKYNLTTSTESVITLPSSMTCSNNGLLYNADRDSLVFVYIQNGLYGLAEIVDP